MMTRIQSTIQSLPSYGVLLRRSTKYCFIASGALFACYLYVIGAITFSVVERKGLEESTKGLLSNISVEELQYLKQEKGLTKEMAYASGLINASTLVFTPQQRAVAWNARP